MEHYDLWFIFALKAIILLNGEQQYQNFYMLWTIPKKWEIDVTFDKNNSSTFYLSKIQQLKMQ